MPRGLEPRGKRRAAAARRSYPDGMMRGTKLAALVAAAALTSTACTLETAPKESSSPADDGRQVELTQSDAAPPRSKISAVVRRVLPSVVNVRVRSFGGGQIDGLARGEGSGVVIDRNGIILTNAHVIRSAVSVRVVFHDRRHDPMEGEVLGAVPERDLAVIQVEADNLDPIVLGHSSGPDGPRLGDPVVALGFPLGLGGPTVTAGIVSGTNRTIEVGGDEVGANRLVGLLQTDAAINPGNSGGALVDLSGRLIGINSAAALASSAENIGFAIAIDDALPVITEILSEPREEHAWLGVQVTAVNELVVDQLGLPSETRGALVAGLIPESPAVAAGVEEGEVIVAIDGAEVDSANDLTARLTDHDPGDEVEIVLLGADGRRSLTIELAQRPESFTP
ncbi:MAG: S1C family serine protease [Actinomycetota bacterium]